jgi:selenocysteine lyase/cysteine desulfurase
VVLPSQRALFDIPDGVAYLNCAQMSPQLRSVTAAGNQAVERKARPWTIRAPDDFFEGPERLRAAFAALIGADADGVAVVPSVSYAMSVAAANLAFGPGRTVVVLEDQFPSNLYVWRELAKRCGGAVVTVPRPPDGNWTPALLGAIDERTAIAALPNCHWTDGGLVDLAAARAATHAVGAALVVDATQSLGALPLDVGALQPDLMVSAGYKWLLGPYSLSLAWFAPRLREGAPLEENWRNRAGSEDFAGLVDYADGYQPGARRYDMGEASQFVLAPMLLAALAQIAEWTPAAIQATIRVLTDRLVERAAPLGLTAPAVRAGHLLGLRAGRGFAPDLPARLAAGSVHVSVRGDAVRVSPHLHNDPADIDRLIEVLATAV